MDNDAQLLGYHGRNCPSCKRLRPIHSTLQTCNTDTKGDIASSQARATSATRYFGRRCERQEQGQFPHKICGLHTGDLVLLVVFREDLAETASQYARDSHFRARFLHGRRLFVGRNFQYLQPPTEKNAKAHALVVEETFGY